MPISWKIWGVSHVEQQLKHFGGEAATKVQTLIEPLCFQALCLCWAIVIEGLNFEECLTAFKTAYYRPQKEEV